MKILKWFTILLVLMLMLAACGGDDDDGGSDNDNGSSNDGDTDTVQVDDDGAVEMVVSFSETTEVQLETVGSGVTREIAVAPNGGSFVFATESSLTNVSLVDDSESSVELGLMRTLDISPDGTKVVGYSETQRRVILWDIVAGSTSELAGIGSAVDLRFSPNGRYIVGTAIGERTALVMWSVDGEILWTVLRDPDDFEEGGASAAFGPDNERLVVGLYDGSLSLRDVQSGDILQVFGGHESGELGTDVVSVAYAPDGNTVASVGQDNRVRVWNTEDGSARHSFAAWQGTVEYSPDSQWVMANRPTRVNSARTWNVETGEIGQIFDVPVDMIPDGTKVYGGARGQDITIYDAFNGHDLVSFEGIDAWDIHEPHPNSMWLMSAYFEDPIIYQWDVSTGEEVKRWTW